MRKFLLIASGLYFVFLIAGTVFFFSLPSFDDVGHLTNGCYRTNAMIVYVECTGRYEPLEFLPNLSLMALFLPGFATSLIMYPVVGTASLLGALLVWWPITWLGWLALMRLPRSVTAALCLLAVALSQASIAGALIQRGKLAMERTALRETAVPAQPAQPTQPPQLWSSHKQLAIQPEACALEAFEALNDLGLSAVVRNGQSVYGTLGNYRAAVKCNEIPGGSFVYFAVAGPQKDAAEQLRNQIAGRM